MGLLEVQAVEESDYILSDFHAVLLSVVWLVALAVPAKVWAGDPALLCQFRKETYLCVRVRQLLPHLGRRTTEPV